MRHLERTSGSDQQTKAAAARERHERQQEARKYGGGGGPVPISREGKEAAVQKTNEDVGREPGGTAPQRGAHEDQRKPAAEWGGHPRVTRQTTTNGAIKGNQDVRTLTGMNTTAQRSSPMDLEATHGHLHTSTHSHTAAA